MHVPNVFLLDGNYRYHCQYTHNYYYINIKFPPEDQEVPLIVASLAQYTQFMIHWKFERKPLLLQFLNILLIHK